ncbi:MAG: GAF domain-containing protein [Rhizobiaceae bacterium]|nr:GAF domain-containing protein [Rhizobiaceae bacterium]
MNAEAAYGAALEAGGSQPTTVFDALNALTDAIVGVRLFTLMTFNAVTGEARRIYSNMPDAYPVFGTKPVNETHWTKVVLDRRETFVANNIDEISQVFDDYELIRSLGCESAINVPVVVDGSVIGTINCLHEAGFYTPERVEASHRLKLPGAAAFLLDRLISAKGA